MFWADVCSHRILDFIAETVSIHQSSTSGLDLHLESEYHCFEFDSCLANIQVGTAVVTRTKDNRLALGRLGALVEQLEALVRSGRQIILVTSGSVCVGRQKLKQQKVLNSTPLEMHLDGPVPISSKTFTSHLVSK